MKMPTSWSFSRWRDFCKCGAFYKYKHLEKRPEPGNDAMLRGTYVHFLAEKYTDGTPAKLPPELSVFGKDFSKLLTGGKISKMPPELKNFSEEFKDLRKRKAVPEEQWTFKKDWSETVWNDWNAAWLRIKIDCNYPLIFDDEPAVKVIDHKTGSMRPQKVEEYTQQLELTAAGGFKRHPQVNIILPELWFLDHGVIYPEEPTPYVRSRDAKKIIKIWENNAAKMLNTTRFDPKPGRQCEWCHYRNSNQGPCKHG